MIRYSRYVELPRKPTHDMLFFPFIFMAPAYFKRLLAIFIAKSTEIVRIRKNIIFYHAGACGER